MLSRLALVSGLAPIIAPVIGSQLLLIVDWRGVFWALAAYGVVVAASAVFFIVETLPPSRRESDGRPTARHRYASLLSDRVFVGVAIIGGMSFSGLFTYLSASSFLFQEGFGLNGQQYGVLFAVNSLGIVVGIQVSSRLTRVVAPQWLLAGSTTAMLVAALLIALGGLLGWGLLGLLAPLWLFIAACGFGIPQVQVLALARHGAEAGTAASVLGAANFGLAGLVSPIVGLFGISAVPMGSVMAVTSAVSIAALWWVVRPRTVPPLEN